MGILYPFYVNTLYEFGKNANSIKEVWRGFSSPSCLGLFGDNRSLRFSVRQLQLKPHKEVLYVRGIVTYFGHNTSLLFYTASLLPLTLP